MLPIVREGLIVAERRRENQNLIRQRMVIRETHNPFHLPDERFIELFRLIKPLVRHVIDIVRPSLEDRLTLKGISFETKILCALRFYAVGSYQRCIGQDFNCGISQTSVHRCVRAVTQVLANISNEYIKWPNTIQERNTMKFEFMHRWNFPGMIGAIDGFHVAILKPHVDEHNFINRKGYHSTNVQIICDQDLKIRSLYPNFGGSTHDSYIWRVSHAQQLMNELYNAQENCWLLGDSGYPLQATLLTPFRNPENQQQHNYNFAHTRARNCVERCIGVLKMRFRRLHKERSARYTPEFMCIVIKACAVLHNICIEQNLPFEGIFEDDVPPEAPHIDRGGAQLGMQMRQNIVNRYF